MRQVKGMLPANSWSPEAWEAIGPFIRLGCMARLERAFDKPYEAHYQIMVDILAMDLNQPEDVDDIRKIKIRRYGISLLERMVSLSIEAYNRGLRLSPDFYDRLEALATVVKQVYADPRTNPSTQL